MTTAQGRLSTQLPRGQAQRRLDPVQLRPLEKGWKMFLKRLIFHGFAPLLLVLLFSPLFAQTHEPDLRWRALETDHFTVLFPQGFYATARKVAGICEDVYPVVSRSLHYFPGKTEVVLHTRSDAANGFVAPVPWRMELYITEPQGNWMGSGDTWLRVLITHEFTHVVHLRKHRGLSSLTAPLLGDLNAFWQGLTPHWFIEGFPTFNETRFTGGGRGRNPVHWMQMAATLINDRPWPLENTNYISRKRLPLGMFYISGYFMSQKAAAVYGDTVWADVLDRYSSWPLFGLNRAFKRETGVGFQTLYRKMITDWKHGLPPSRPPKRGEGRYWHNPSRPEQQLSPRWFGANALLVYRTSFDVLPGLVLLHRDGRVQTVLVRQLSNQENGFTAGDGKIFWSEIKPNPRYRATQLADLFTLDLATGKRSRLTRKARLYSPDYCSRAHRLVAVQTRLPGNQLVEVDPVTGELDTLFYNAKLVLLTPRWSPDGGKIALAVKDSLGRQDIAVFELSTGRLIFPFGRDRFHDASPCWTPDGRYIVFSSDRDGRFNLWAVDWKAGKLWRITDSVFGAFSPDISALGREIAYTEYGPWGFRAAVTRFDPDTWLPADSVRFHPLPGILPKSQVARQKSPEFKRTFRTHKYHVLLRVVRPRGWLPLVLQDSNGFLPGLFLLSEDALHRAAYQGMAGVSTVSGRPSYDFFFRFSRFWPAASLEFYNLPQHSTLNGKSHWWRKKGGKALLNFPYLAEANAYSTTVRGSAGIEWEKQSAAIPGWPYTGSLLYLQFSRSGSALRDLYTHRTVSLAALFRRSLKSLHSWFEARQWAVAGQVVFPAFFSHQAFQILAAHEERRGNYPYSLAWALPVGFNDTGNRKFWRYRMAYYLPVSYFERKLPLLPVYVDYLGGGLFFDGFRSSGNLFARTQKQLHAYSTGLQLHLGTYLYHNLPLRIGFSVFYQSLERRWKTAFSLTTPLTAGPGFWSKYLKTLWDGSTVYFPFPEKPGK